MSKKGDWIHIIDRGTSGDLELALKAQHAPCEPIDTDLADEGLVPAIDGAMPFADWSAWAGYNGMGAIDSMLKRGGDHIWSHPFREMCVESADGEAEFWDANDPETSGEQVEAAVMRCSRRKGPFRVSMAIYERKGDPHIVSAMLRRLRTGYTADAERLIFAGLPNEAVSKISGVPYCVVYKTAKKLRDDADESGEKSLCEEVATGVYTGDIRSEQPTTEAT